MLRNIDESVGRRRFGGLPSARSAGPKVGDFVLFDDYTWKIIKVTGDVVVVETVEDIGIDQPEEFVIDNLAPTGIKTWEVE